MFLPNGSRVILKNKNEKWTENKKSHKSAKAKADISDTARQLSEAILDYITENRMNNVISKVGQVSFNDKGKLTGLLCKDVLDDFGKDHGTTFNLLEKKEQKAVKKELNKEGGKFVRKFLLYNL